MARYLSRAALLLRLSPREATEPLPSRTDCTIATGRTGGSEEHTSQEEARATASAPAPPLPPPLTPGLTGSSLISMVHLSLWRQDIFISVPQRLVLGHRLREVILGPLGQYSYIMYWYILFLIRIAE